MSGYEFSKQPVSPPPASDNEVVSSDGGEQPRPLSLLSSMMAGQASPKRKTLVSGYTSGPSAPSTAPSTTFSSPQPQDEPVSILRRNSIGSDGEPFFLPLARVLPISPEKKPEPLKQTRASALKFAVTSRPVAPERPISSTVPQHDDNEDDQGTNTDKGYEEDSEGGFSSDDDEPSFLIQAHKMALARAREAQLAAARPTSASPPPRIAPPPSRRGRGHVRVDPAAGGSDGRCSRHYSPPPDSRPRSAPPGPRDGRAGSPLPERFDMDDEDDEDDVENLEGNNDKDDENLEDNNDVVVDTDSEDDNEAKGVSFTPANDIPWAPASSIGTGVRNMLRRASEHLPTFRRPSFTAPIPEDSAIVLDDVNGSTDNGRVLLSRARSLGSRTKPVVSTLSSPSQDNSIPSRPIACPTNTRT